MIRTLIVEDDFRVATLHSEFVAKVGGFDVVGLVHTASAALDAAAKHHPELILLDLYLPDVSGLEVLRRLRAQSEPPDVIVLTAAREMGSVRAAMRAGALHYLIKPFDYEVLRERMTAYAELHAARAVHGEVDQRKVDSLFGLLRRGGRPAMELPKGHSEATAGLIIDALTEAGEELSAADVADRVGISRATAQRYLALLSDAGDVKLTLRYGRAGRPEHRYGLEHGRAAGA
jgi:two-component system CitB family response regulator